MRLFKLMGVVWRTGLDRWIFPPWLRCSWWLQDPTLSEASLGERLRDACCRMGPVVIKAGQLLSVRRDVLPAEVADALVALQDRVPPMSFTTVRDTLARTWEAPVEQRLASLDVTPLGSGSMAQVHAATLVTGERVVVKVLRPGLADAVQKDMRALGRLARWLAWCRPSMRHLQLKEVVATVATTLVRELDMRQEGANASLLAHHHRDDPQVEIPEVVWAHTTEHVLVMSHMHGVCIRDHHVLRAAGVDLDALARMGMALVFQQMFQHTCFHADMHPGNLLVNVDNPQAPKLQWLDFGIIGHLHPDDRDAIAQNFLAMFDRDYRRIAQLHVDVGWLPEDADLEAFEMDMRRVCEPLLSQALGQVSFHALLRELLEVSRRYQVRMQPQLLLLQKTLFQIEGLGQRLSPGLDVWSVAKPCLEAAMIETVDWKTVARSWQQALPKWLRLLPELPDLLSRACSERERRC